MLRYSKGVVFLVIAGILVFQKGLCFSEEIDPVKQTEWNPVSAGPVTTWTAPLCDKGKFVIQPFFFYNHRTYGLFDSKRHYDSLPKGDKKYQYQQQLFIQYGLTDRFEAAAQTVYQENYAKEGNLKAHSKGFGDSYLFLRYRALEEKNWLPYITGLFQLKIPTGKYQHANHNKLGSDLMGAVSGGGSWDPGFGLNLTKKYKPFILHADIVQSLPQKVRVDGVKTIYAPYLNYDFAVEYFLPKDFNLITEVNSFWQGNKKQDGKRISDSDINYLAIAMGIGLSNDKLQALPAYQKVITSTNTDANDSLIRTFVYTF